MKVQFVGKVVARSRHRGKDGQDRYTIVVEEPGQYPSPFAFTIKDPAPLGDANGFAAVGKTVQVSGYLNGKCEELNKKDGSGKWKKYSMWLTLSSIKAHGQSKGSQQASEPADEYPDDVPW